MKKEKKKLLTHRLKRDPALFDYTIVRSSRNSVLRSFGIRYWGKGIVSQQIWRGLLGAAATLPSLLSSLGWSSQISLGQWTIGIFPSIANPFRAYFSPGVAISVCQWHVAYCPLNHPGLCQFIAVLGNIAGDNPFYWFLFLRHRNTPAIYLNS